MVQIGTFDAGKIEAVLTLDRSPFKRELAAARAEVATFEKKKLNKTLHLDADVAAALGELEAVDEAVDKIPEKKTTKINIETGNGVSRTQALITAVLAGLPLIPAVAAPAAAGIMGLSASLTAAAGGAVILTAGLVGAVQRFNEVKEAGGRMTPEMLKFGAAISVLGTQWDRFIAVTQNMSFTVMTTGIKILSDLLPRLVPVFTAFANVANGALKAVGGWFNGPEGQAMLTWFQTFGAMQFGVILGILGDMGRIFINLMMAFSPFATTMMNGLRSLTTGWVAWSAALSSNTGFQEFMAYVQQIGPQVLATMGSLVNAIGAILRALAPLAPVLLSVIKGFADFISGMNPAVLTGIIVAVGSLVAVWTAYEAVASIVRAGMILWTALMGAWRAVTMLATAAQWLLNAALLANPIGLVIIAIVALVAALVIAYQNSETFRNIVNAAWAAIKTAIAATINWIVNTAVPWVMNAATQIAAFFTRMKDRVVSDWNALYARVSAIVNTIRAVITAVVAAIVARVVSDFNTIRNFVTTAVNAVRAVMTAQFNAARTAVTTAVNAVRTAVTAAFNAVRSVVSAVTSAVSADVSSRFNAVRSVVTSVANAVRAVVTSQFQAARAAAVAAFAAMYAAVVGRMNAMRSTIAGVASSIRGIFAGAGGWLVGAGRAIIDGLISGVRSGIGALQGMLSSVTNMIPDWKGPRERDAILLRPAGRLIMKGLIGGIKDQINPLKSTLAGITDMVGGGSYGLAGATGGGGSLALRGTMAPAPMAVTFNNYYPVAERSSERATRQMTEMAVLGVFSR